jgi:hypothetical protein
MTDIVYNELNCLQLDYLKLLKKIKLNIDENFKPSLDEINMFWLKRKKFVFFLLNEYFTPYNAFLFTGATFLDCKQNEQFPFVVCNGICIVDDNVCSYGNMIGKIDDDTFNKTIKEQFLLTINDNINILEKYSNYIFILPIQYLDNEDELAYQGAETVFLKLFKIKFKNLKDYFTKVITIEDLENNLCVGIEKSLKLYENDDNKLALAERLKNYIDNASENLDLTDKSIGYIFFSSVFSHMSKTFNIIQICIKYKLIPYLRYNVIFHYFSHLLENFNKLKEYNIFKFKAYTCYLIYKSFNLQSVNESMFDKFVQEIKESNIYERVYEKLMNKKNDESLQEISDFAQIQLKSIIDRCI